MYLKDRVCAWEELTVCKILKRNRQVRGSIGGPLMMKMQRRPGEVNEGPPGECCHLWRQVCWHVFLG